MSCFAAGMLLTLSICHILPEANEKYEEMQLGKEHKGHPFPLPFVLFLCGFLFLLFLD